jgi:hypothetical protein
MGNQQERSHFKIGYLLGVIDGEGSFQLGNDGYGHYVPEIVISNTDDKIISLVVEALKELGLPAYVWTPKNTKSNHKPVTRVCIRGIKRLAKVMGFLQNFDYAKKDRGQVIKDFCDYRLSVPIAEKYSNKRYNSTPYGSHEDEFKRRLTLLNMTGIRKNTKMSEISSETIRLAPPKGDDIVRPYMRV